MKLLMTLGAPKAGPSGSSKDPNPHKISIYVFLHILFAKWSRWKMILEEKFCGWIDFMWTSFELVWCWISFCSHQKVNMWQLIGGQKHQMKINPSRHFFQTLCRCSWRLCWCLQWAKTLMSSTRRPFGARAKLRHYAGKWNSLVYMKYIWYSDCERPTFPGSGTTIKAYEWYVLDLPVPKECYLTHVSNLGGFLFRFLW